MTDNLKLRWIPTIYERFIYLATKRSSYMVYALAQQLKRDNQ